MIYEYMNKLLASEVGYVYVYFVALLPGVRVVRYQVKTTF
jgi:hypothetical protein